MSDIPSKNANSLQIVQMCNAMSLLGHKVNLIIPNLKNLINLLDNFMALNQNLEFLRSVQKKKKF